MVFNLFHSFTLPLIFALSAAAFNNTVYIISNAETPSLGLPGLTPIGFQRANDCLPSVRWIDGAFPPTIYSKIQFIYTVARSAWYRVHRNMSFRSWLGPLLGDYNNGYSDRKRPRSTPQHNLVSKAREMPLEIGAHPQFRSVTQAELMKRQTMIVSMTSSGRFHWQALKLCSLFGYAEFFFCNVGFISLASYRTWAISTPSLRTLILMMTSKETTMTMKFPSKNIIYLYLYGFFHHS